MAYRALMGEGRDLSEFMPASLAALLLQSSLKPPSGTASHDGGLGTACWT
jgi:hypothetical protein